mgnify:CR=1 FL=1
MKDITSTITKSLAILGENGKGYTKEANFISWNGNAAKLDIREWHPNHERCGKGITLTEDEGRNLYAALKVIYEKDNPFFRLVTGRSETDAPIFTEGGDDRGEYENRLCGENRRHDFRCQRNARRERKAYAGGACKGSDCKRSNGFAGSRCCLIDFTHSYALWRFFKKYLKTT